MPLNVTFYRSKNESNVWANLDKIETMLQDLTKNGHAAAVGLGALLYILSRDDDQPRCPYCSAFVKKYARRCTKCHAKLGWE